MHYYRSLLFVALFLGLQVHAVLNGDPITWSRNSFLVKVFARDRGSSIRSCTGALISNNLVITSASCVTNPTTHETLQEFAVLFSIRGGSRRERASLVEQWKNWALLAIREINAEKLCPIDPEPKSVLRINLKPTLKGTSVLKVTSDEIVGSKCYLVAFNTTEKASKFMSTSKAVRLNVNILKPYEDSVYYRAIISDNRTACFDDAGSPLICETTGHGTMLVGLFQALGAPATQELEVETLERCTIAHEMYFSMVVEDSHLIDFIEQFEIGSFVKTYATCGFLQDYEIN